MSLTVSHRLRCLRASACANAVKSSNHPFTIAHQAGVGAFPRDTFCQFANSFASGRPPKSSPVRALCALRWSSAGSFCDSLRHASNAFFAAFRERSNAASPLAVSLTFPALSTGILPSTDTFRLVSRFLPLMDMRPYHVGRNVPSAFFTIFNPILHHLSQWFFFRSVLSAARLCDILCLQ